MNRWFLILAIILALPFMCNAQRKRAFMVGISKYRTNGYRVWDNIHGAEDVALLTPVLKGKGFAVKSLTNEQATYQNIINSLNSFIMKSQKGDIIYFHFSCHGQPVEDGLKGDSIDESDHWDESLVPVDAGKLYNEKGYKGEKHLTDDELNMLTSKLRKKIGTTGMLYIAIDACHAGTVSKGGLETVRGTKDGLCSNPNCKYTPPETNVRHYLVRKEKGMSPVLFLEACQSFERNSEIRIMGKEYGALSYNIYQALKEMRDFNKSTKEEFIIMVESSKKVSNRWPRTQTLVVEE